MGVIVLTERIEIGANSALEEDGVLRDDSECGTQIMKTDLTNVDTVDGNGTTRQLDNSEQSNHNRRLSGTSTSNYSLVPISRGRVIPIPIRSPPWMLRLRFLSTAGSPSLYLNTTSFITTSPFSGHVPRGFLSGKSNGASVSTATA